MSFTTAYITNILNGSFERPEEGLDHCIMLSNIPKHMIQELINIENGYDCNQKSVAWRYIVYKFHKVLHQYAEYVKKEIQEKHGKNYSVFAVMRQVKKILNNLENEDIPHFQSTVMFSELWLPEHIKYKDERYTVKID